MTNDLAALYRALARRSSPSARFPVLADQVRSSFGFTHAPGGVPRLPPNWSCGQVLPLEARPVVASAPPRRRRRRA